jgi:hypothetical protein
MTIFIVWELCPAIICPNHQFLRRRGWTGLAAFLGSHFSHSGVVYGRFSGFNNRRPTLSLLINHVLAALLEGFTLVVDTG